MAQSITVSEIILESPDGTQITLRLDNDGYLVFGPDGGKRLMIDKS
ncbi:hypothetical protein [Fodinibius sp. Rm-B-1B1-1]